MDEIRKSIGSVTFADGKALIELMGVDQWRATVDGAEDADLAETISLLYQGKMRGPQYGRYGFAVLKDLADRTKGTMEFPDPPEGGEEDPDIVY